MKLVDTPSSSARMAEVACPISPVVGVLFSRWTTPIIWSLHQYGRMRFVELERQLGAITPKVLTQRLRQLERDGLVTRTFYAEVPPRVEYEVTALGLSLGQLFASLESWGADNMPNVDRARADYDTAHGKGRSELVAS